MRVNEIFTGVSGEVGAFRQGSWCSFIRLAGCNLRCKWCDTVQAQEKDSGKEMSVREVSNNLPENINQVLITGGEPLLQMEAIEDLVLIRHDLNPSCRFQIETNGTIFPSEFLLEKTCCVFDYKLPSSGMQEKMIPFDSFPLQPHWIKFVIANNIDYRWARRIALLMQELSRSIAFSACPPDMSHNELFQRMKNDNLMDILLSVQIHKLTKLQESVK